MEQRVERGAWAHLWLLWRPILDLPISPNGAKGRSREGGEAGGRENDWSLPLPSHLSLSGAYVGWRMGEGAWILNKRGKEEWYARIKRVCNG